MNGQRQGRVFDPGSLDSTPVHRSVSRASSANRAELPTGIFSVFILISI